MELLKGKTAMVTGGTRGIGYAIVKTYLDNGAAVALCGSRQLLALHSEATLKGHHQPLHDGSLFGNAQRPYRDLPGHLMVIIIYHHNRLACFAKTSVLPPVCAIVLRLSSPTGKNPQETG